MIGWLSGKIVDRQQLGHLVVDVNGVGYDVETSLHTFFQLESQINDHVGLHIHTIVREDAFILFGFIDKSERALFRSLIKVNGIGPKMAMVILSHLTPNEFVQTLHQQDLFRLTKVPGIGKKTAERLLIEMKDTINQLTLPFKADEAATKVSSCGLRQAASQAISALESLGFKHQEAMNTVKKIDDQKMDCETLIRQALKQYS